MTPQRGGAPRVPSSALTAALKRHSGTLDRVIFNLMLGWFDTRTPRIRGRSRGRNTQVPVPVCLAEAENGPRPERNPRLGQRRRRTTGPIDDEPQERRPALALMMGRHRSDVPVLGPVRLGLRRGGVAVPVVEGVFAGAGRLANHLVEDDPHPLYVRLAELLE